ncbi:MAG: efflux RND transporter periplasmic adaptor subunit [Halieaceae bacterium]|nr:efflux RND transporter periplasmic adaptor subunit [Halieaceae bacterium]
MQWLPEQTGLRLAIALLVSSTTVGARADALPALDCVINPHKVFDIGSQVRGVLDTVHLERGEYVEQGQVVAELDAGVERAAMAVAQARADISSEMLLGKLNLEFDTRRKERIANLYANNSVSIQNKEDAELAAELSQQRLQEATERERIRELELWRSRELLEQKVIRSPGSGFVLKKFKSAGEYVEDQPIVRIAQLDTLNVEVIAPMDLFGQIRTGMTAQVYPEGFEGTPRTAQVEIVDPMGDVASGTFGARLILANEDYAVPAGVKCQLQFDAAPQHADTDIGASLRAAKSGRSPTEESEEGGKWAVIDTDNQGATENAAEAVSGQ